MITKAVVYLIAGIVVLAMLPTIAVQLISVVGPMVVQGLTIVAAVAAVGAVVWFVLAATRHRRGPGRHGGSWRARDPWRF